MNPRVLAFLIWIVFCIAMAVMYPLLAALAVISMISVLALGLRWVCRTMLQAPSGVSSGHPTESVRQENY
ncbi:MAG: hypothetical protein ABIQ06_14815 [Caldimonas sp.]